MICEQCKHYCTANGGFWCECNQALQFPLPTVNTYPCSYFEPATKVVSISSTGSGDDLNDAYRDTLIKAGKAMGENIGRLVGESISEAMTKEHDCLVLSSRLAESILMNWDKDKQIELARDVASRTHEILFGED